MTNDGRAIDVHIFFRSMFVHFLLARRLCNSVSLCVKVSGVAPGTSSKFSMRRRSEPSLKRGRSWSRSVFTRRAASMDHRFSMTARRESPRVRESRTQVRMIHLSRLAFRIPCLGKSQRESKSDGPGPGAYSTESSPRGERVRWHHGGRRA